MSSVEPSPPPTAGASAQREDRVVRELDVYVCNSLAGAQSQTYLLQYPLRPPYRPYTEEGFQSVRVKSKVKRMQAQVAVERGGAAPPGGQESLTLQSSRVDMRTQFAVGVVRDGKLVLMAVDEALQLRPMLSGAKDEGKRGAGGGEEATEAAEEEEEKPQEPQPVVVQVKRRETEQQQEARLRSYAYLAAQEEQDPWVDLQYHGPYSQAAEGVWQKADELKLGPVAHTMTRQQYLAAIVPGSHMEIDAGRVDMAPQQQQQQQHQQQAQAGPSRAAPAAAAPGPRGGGRGDALPPERVAQLAGPMKTFFSSQEMPVVRLDHIRSFFMHLKDQDGLVHAVTAASDTALHAALTAPASGVASIRGWYLRKALGNPVLDPFRTVLLGLLVEKESLKKGEMIEAAKAAGLAVSEAVYSKVVKELCHSRASLWTLGPRMTE